MRLRPLPLVLAFVLAACGGSDPEPPAETAQAPVDQITEATPVPGGGDVPLSTTPPPPVDDNASPAINSIAVDPGDGTIVVGSGPALFRIDPGAKEGERIIGQLTTPNGPGTVFGNLVVRFKGPNELLGSGHPYQGGLPENLPLIHSTDHGDTWEVVPDTTEGDYHELEVFGDRIFAVDVESPEILVGTDGINWEKRTPPERPIDVVVNPDDPQQWAISTEQGTFLSTDDGNSWRPRDTAQGARLAWPKPDALYSLERNGVLRVSSNAGKSFKEAGDVGGLPSEFTAGGQKAELYAAVVGGKIRSSSDGGKSWTTVATLR